MNTTARDNQRQRVYDSEIEVPSYWGQTIPNDGLQAYVDALLDKRAIRSRWGRQRMVVALTHDGGRADGYRTVRLGVAARNPRVICHEIAHNLNPAGCAPHGPEFAGIFLMLLETAGERDAAATLRAAFKAHRVRVSRKGIPAVRAVVAPSTAEQSREAAAARRKPLEGREPVTLARLLRRAIAAGEFGPAGSACRDKALATARHIERTHSVSGVAARG